MYYLLLAYLAALAAGLALIFVGTNPAAILFLGVGFAAFIVAAGVIVVIVAAILIIITAIKALLNKKHC
jgi:hypothetical protein